MTEGEDFEVTVSESKNTLWVNNAYGECMGRFDRRFGIDVHTTVAQVHAQNLKVQCQYYVQGDVDNPPMWDKFIDAMALIHNVEIREDLMLFGPARYAKATVPLTRCASDRDGDCTHVHCPQLKDGEPAKSGRHCPLDGGGDGRE